MAAAGAAAPVPALEDIQRVPLPSPENRTVHNVGGCNYHRFNIGLAVYLECPECEMRTLLENHTSIFYHYRQCRFWTDLEIRQPIISIPNLINFRQPDEIIIPRFIINTNRQSNGIAAPVITTNTDGLDEIPPPPYSPQDDTLPDYTP